MFAVYIIYSAVGKRYYIGQTNDLESRIRRHNNKTEPSTSPFVPWKLILSIEKTTRSEAVMLEKKLKNLNTEDLEKFITKYS